MPDTLEGDGPSSWGWSGPAGSALQGGRVGTLRRLRLAHGYSRALARGWSYFLHYVSSQLRLPFASLRHSKTMDKALEDFCESAWSKGWS